MKAVEFRNVWLGQGTFYPVKYDHDGRMSDLIDGRTFCEVESVEVRYDNGQLCKFRRKTKGQNNER